MSKNLLLMIALLAASPLAADTTPEPQQCQTSLCPSGVSGQSSTCPVNPANGQPTGCLDVSAVASEIMATACAAPAALLAWWGQALPGGRSATE